MLKDVCIIKNHSPHSHKYISIINYSKFIDEIHIIESVDKLIEAHQNLPFDVLMIFVDNSFKSIRELIVLRNFYNDKEIIVLSASNDETFVLKILKSNVSGFLFLNQNKENILHDLSRLRFSKMVFSDNILKILFNKISNLS